VPCEIVVAVTARCSRVDQLKGSGRGPEIKFALSDVGARLAQCAPAWRMRLHRLRGRDG